MSTLVKDVPESPAAGNERTTSELARKLLEIGAKVPDAAWREIPADASANYRHYLHGKTKKTT